MACQRPTLLIRSSGVYMCDFNVQSSTILYDDPDGCMVVLHMNTDGLLLNPRGGSQVCP